MQIVIDISKETYDDIQSMDWKNNIWADDILRAIHNGAPLPKGHGRLGDLDELENYFRYVRSQLKPDSYKSGIEFFTRDEILLSVQQYISLNPTIIEADKPEKGENKC